MSTGAGEVSPLRVGALLRMGHEIAERTVLEVAAAAGFGELRPAHFRLMRFPGLDGARPADLAARVGASKQAVNPLLNDLERWGYIEREVCPDDERGRVVRLTPRGRALMAAIWDAHARLEARWEERVGRKRFEILRRTLRELTVEHPAAGGEPAPLGASRDA